MSMIEARNISKSFGYLEVLKNINVSIKKGEIVATYNARGMGPFTKTVYVKTNASEQKVSLLMKGEVIKQEQQHIDKVSQV